MVRQKCSGIRRSYLVGGGSYLIEPAVREHFDKSKIIMVDNPQFALSLAIADTVFA
ncbi:plasmid segregation protein ParM domain-containing protein [Klebsiella grimontii]|uniref:plasmid segregation protein ParM domain-containing protein n=1 Tax=Klebsiella grimontii TaxID=2058152 RepID=UPI0009E4B7C1|nr:plasmid segregation protein ParM domain-containing protein [Klebsiella grimontii]